MRIIQNINDKVDEVVITSDLEKTIFETNTIYYGAYKSGEITGNVFNIQYEKCNVAVKVCNEIDPIVERLKL